MLENRNYFLKILYLFFNINQFSHKKVEKMSKIVEVMANLLTQGRLNFTVN